MWRPSAGIRTVFGGAVFLGLAPSPPRPSAVQDVSGTWDVTWAQAVRINRDGSMEIQRWGPATLVLHQDGEAVTGTWTTRVAGVVRWNVEGTCRGGRLELSAHENDSDDPELAVVSGMRWRATVDGDRLEGEMMLELRGSDRARPWRPWRAQRKPAG